MDGSQQKRLKLNKVLLEKVTVADASQDQKVVPASYKKYHKWFCYKKMKDKNIETPYSCFLQHSQNYMKGLVDDSL